MFLEKMKKKRKSEVLRGVCQKGNVRRRKESISHEKEKVMWG